MLVLCSNTKITTQYCYKYIQQILLMIVNIHTCDNTQNT